MVSSFFIYKEKQLPYAYIIFNLYFDKPLWNTAWDITDRE